MSIFKWKNNSNVVPNNIPSYIKPNNEIVNIVKEALYGNTSIIRTNSLAGSGKTTLLKIISEYYLARTAAENMDNKILYLAYSKRLKEEASSLMDYKVSCKSLLDLQEYSIRYKNTKISSKKYTAEVFQRYFKVDYSIAYDISQIMNSWLRSYLSEDSMSNFAYSTTISGEAAHYAHTYATEAKCSFESTFINEEFLIKELQLQFIQDTPLPKENEVDLLLVDEGQDLSDAALSIFLNFPAKKKIIVGDSNQKIYPNVSSKNALFKEFDKSIEYPLTCSYRHSQEVANRANNILRLFKNSKRQIISQQNQQFTTIRKYGYLYRWKENAIHGLELAKKRGINSIELADELKYFFEFMIDLYAIDTEKKPHFASTIILEYTKKKTKQFNEKMCRSIGLIDFVKYHLPEELLKGDWVQAKYALKKYDIKEIIDLYNYYLENSSTRTNQPKLTITSIYKSKGFEFDSIALLPGMKDLASMVADYFIKTGQLAKRGEKYNFIKEFAEQIGEKERSFKANVSKWTWNINLYYTALTRARNSIEDLTINANYIDEKSLNKAIFPFIKKFKNKNPQSIKSL